MEKKPAYVKEMIVFSIGMGLMAGYLSYSSFTGISPTAPELWGMSRSMAIGLPTALIAVGFLISGIALAVTRQEIWVSGSILAGVLSSVFYFALMVSAGTLGVNLISVIMVALPLLLLSRGKAAMEELRLEQEIPSV